MASWTNQSTSSLLPGEPWTSAKALAAFENPTALAEGASGAPRVRTVALQPPVAGTTTVRQLKSISAIYTSPETSATASLAEGSITALVAGTIRMATTVSTAGTVTTFSVIMKKNGVAFGTFTTIGAKTADVTVAIGDRIEVDCTVNGGGGSGTVTAGSLVVQSATADLAVS